MCSCCLFSVYFPFLSYQKTPWKTEGEVLVIRYQSKKLRFSSISADEATNEIGVSFRKWSFQETS